jgi:hypothetical protein
MITKDRLMLALHKLHSLAVESLNCLQDNCQSMRDLFHKLSTHSHIAINTSSVKAIMQCYSLPLASAYPHHSNPSPDPIVASTATFSHPTPGMPVGDFLPKLFWCHGCGAPDHVFRSCPLKDNQHHHQPIILQLQCPIQLSFPPACIPA